MRRLLAAALVALCLCTAAAMEAEYMKYKDPKQPLRVRIKDLLSRMTLEEKIGQMTQIERKVASADIMKKYFIGSIVSGGGSVPGLKASAEAWINMVNEFQTGSLSTRLGIPMIYGIDAVHGQNNVYNATIFPHNVELVKKIGAATALEVRATGISYAFAPCIAVCRDPRWGRCYESYSEDHKIVQSMTEIIPGLQGEIPSKYPKNFPFVGPRTKVAGCAKHFVGDGGTTDGINENNTVIDWNGLQNIHMPAYIDSIRQGVATVMGFVISDMWGIDRITTPSRANYTFSVQAGIHAGIDMVMVPEEYVEFIDDLTLLVKKNLANHLGSKEHRELAREAVRKSLVLLKNGTHADDIGNQCGGWTIEWKGLSGDITSGTTILTAVKNSVDPSTEVIYNVNPDREFLKSNNFSYAIVAVGELPYVETFGDSKTLTIAEPGYSTMTDVCESVRCVVVIVSGRPVFIEPYLEKIDALVAAWLPGTEGQGIADVLFGDYGFTGKLARTWFRTVDQLPMNVGDSDYDPLFGFGYGLITSPRVVKASQ
ncbi:beta-glucosidase bogh3b [Phtheirospermum japonicum]|uniref:beta-glucosidase n=1 Tax=Phtheirospermum japonicum TaxID=374723 RepID=A0A830BTR1_9LAMI|nr:beta-glucosidase bogh3b [Phtheirospermum japonicum]